MDLEWPPDTVEALTLKIGHPQPWSAAELRSVRHTRFEGGQLGIPQLQHLPGLRILRIGPWRQPALADLRLTPDLRRLRIWDCTEVDLALLPEVAPNLQHVELKRCYVDDLSPLLDLPNLRSINLDGLPMSQDSWRRVVPALLERGIPHVGNYPMMADDEWQIMHALRQRGLTLSVYRGAWGNAGIKAVGDDDHPTIVFHQLENLAAAVGAFAGQLSLDALWRHLEQASDDEPEPPESEA